MVRRRLLPSTLAAAALLAACSRSQPASSAAPSLGVAPSANRTETAALTAASLIGETPPEWQAERWLNSPPLHLADTRGKVVLVRWWTDGCPFCSATAPALRRFDHDYAPLGLVVVGMYHFKTSSGGPVAKGESFDPAVYEETAKKYGFTFPVALDPEWHTLNRWLHGVDTGFTSVTFVLDRKGAVRHVHPGGQYVEGDASYAAMRREIEALLKEPG